MPFGTTYTKQAAEVTKRCSIVVSDKLDYSCCKKVHQGMRKLLGICIGHRNGNSGVCHICFQLCGFE